jgi:putative transposase
MARKRLEMSSLHPYHLWARCINKEWFQIPLPEVWRVYTNYLHFINQAFDVEIYSFVLMSNHFHLLMRTPNQNLDVTMNYFMRETSRTIAGLSGRINQIYGGPYGGSLIKSEHYFRHAYKYVYRNPVEAGACGRVEEYPFSTLSGLIGLTPLHIPLVEDTIFFENPNNCIEWLNSSYKHDHKDQIRRALRRHEFEFPNYRNNNSPSKLVIEPS